jgi:mono/diheme cytochrome c family protein
MIEVMYRRTLSVAAAATTMTIALGTLGTLPVPVAAAADAVATTPTFTKDIAPIFQEKCEACHRPDSMAPMSLKTYADVRPVVRAIRSRVAARQMPPWQIDRTVGIQRFKNDRSLTDEQLDTILRWIDAGAPQGDPKDMPPPKQWPSDQGWNFAHLFGQ